MCPAPFLHRWPILTMILVQSTSGEAERLTRRIELLIPGGEKSWSSTSCRQGQDPTPLNHQRPQTPNRPYACVSSSPTAPSLQFVQVAPRCFHRIVLHSVSPHCICIPGVRDPFCREWIGGERKGSKGVWRSSSSIGVISRLALIRDYRVTP